MNAKCQASASPTASSPASACAVALSRSRSFLPFRFFAGRSPSSPPSLLRLSCDGSGAAPRAVSACLNALRRSLRALSQRFLPSLYGAYCLSPTYELSSASVARKISAGDRP